MSGTLLTDGKKSKAEIGSTDQPAGSGFADMGLESARQVAHKCSRSQRSDVVTADTNRIPVSVTGVFVCKIWEKNCSAQLPWGLGWGIRASARAASLEEFANELEGMRRKIMKKKKKSFRKYSQWECLMNVAE